MKYVSSLVIVTKRYSKRWFRVWIKLGFRVRFKLAGVGWGENRQLIVNMF